MLHIAPIIALPSYSSQPSSWASSKRSCARGDTWALSRNTTSKLLLALFSHLRSRWFQSRTSQMPTDWYRISHTHTRRARDTCPSIKCYNRMIFLAHGAPSPPCASSVYASLRDHRLRSATWPKPIARFPWTHPSGLVRLSACPTTTNSYSTRMQPSELGRMVVCTVMRQMPEQTSCDHKDWAPSQNGLTTTFSSESCENSLLNTTVPANSGVYRSSITAVHTVTAGAYGMVAIVSPMAASTSLSKTCVFPYEIWQPRPFDLPRTRDTRVVWQTLTQSLRPWGFPGKSKRTSLSHTSSPSQALCGTWKHSRSPSHPQRPKSTDRQSATGSRRERTLWRRSKSYMVSSSTPRWWSLQGDVTSLNWNPCWASSTTVLSCLVPLLEELPRTWTGGTLPSRSNPSPDPSQPPSQSRDWRPTPTQAPGPELQLSSETGGEHGPFGRAGTETGETSAGRKQSASNSWYVAYSPSPVSRNACAFSETTQVWSMAGNEDGVGTELSTRRSSASIARWWDIPPNSSSATYPADTTRQTTHLEATTHQTTSSSLQSTSQKSSARLSTTSSWTDLIGTITPIRPNSRNPAEASSSDSPVSTLQRTEHRTRMTPSSDTSLPGPSNARRNAPLPPTRVSTATPRPYPAHLQLAPSTRRPHCLAHDRIRLWLPAASQRQATDSQ
ncbi:uncharacterized protein B0H18DRAFT_908353, partial [Fomitopsis serialis]|uniref:uncharacterized protein n=1 Tax=Fomitopsis serialis TaxID=139415 RepID=UPI002008554F